MAGPSKIIQIAAHPAGIGWNSEPALYALGINGDLWSYNPASDTWRQINLISAFIVTNEVTNDSGVTSASP